MSKKPRGRVWDHYLKVEDGGSDLKSTSQCKHCFYKVKGNTCHLSEHLERIHISISVEHLFHELYVKIKRRHFLTVKTPRRLNLASGLGPVFFFACVELPINQY